MSSITSTDTFDLVHSSITFEVWSYSSAYPTVGIMTGKNSGGPSEYVGFSAFNKSKLRILDMQTRTSGTMMSVGDMSLGYSHLRVSIDGSTLKWEHSTGGAFTLLHSRVLSSTELLFFRSVRVEAEQGSVGSFYLGSVNPATAPPVVDIETQNSSASVVMSGVSITRNASLSTNSLASSTGISELDLVSAINLYLTNHSIQTKIDANVLDVTRGLLPSGVGLNTFSSSPQMTKNAQISANNLLSTTSLSDTEVFRAWLLDIQNQSVSTSLSGITLAVVRNMQSDNLVVILANSSADMDRFLSVSADNVEVVASASGVSLVSEMLLSIQDQIISVGADNVSLNALRQMGVLPLSVAVTNSHTLAQVGYPVSELGSDNIYSLGVIAQGDYEVATLNNNEIYEVVEQDGI